MAFDVLSAVRDADAYANLLLPTRISRAELSPADAALATELTYGTLRMRGSYDAVIAKAAGRPVDQIDPVVLDVLRLGAHQLLSMRTATHAAVDQSVELVRHAARPRAAGFVNGVLRTISRTDPGEWLDRILADSRDRVGALAVRYSHPEWIVRALEQALEAEQRGDELEDLLDADNDSPRVTLARIELDEATDATGAEHGSGAAVRAHESGALTPTPYSPVGVTGLRGDPAAHPAVRDGRLRVQDEGSQLAALALSRARPIRPGERWLDMCAGPGGKAALLAAEALAGGAAFTANELVPGRAGLVRQALATLGAGVEVTVGDGTRIGEEHPSGFDRIMLDAPCTGLGALRRRPEARWRKSPRDVAELAELQGRLLDSAVAAIRPGGVIAYVTCSPHPGETRLVVDAAIRRAGGALERLDTPEVLQRVARSPLDLPEGRHAQLWPHRHGTDAMFIQLLTRVAT